MLTDWDKQTPGRVEAIFKSLTNVSVSQLADTNLFDFQNLTIDRSSEKQAYEFEKEQVSSSNIDESLYIDVTNI